MKNKILFITSVLLLFCISLSSRETQSTTNSPEKDSITIVSSPDLIALTSIWAEEYQNLNPGVKINIIPVTEKGVIDLNTESNLGFVSQEYFLLLNKESIWKEIVGRDVYVPVINSGNPYLNEILVQGISPENLAQVLTGSEKMNWGTLIENAKNSTVNYYYVENELVKTNVAEFLKADKNIIEGISLTGTELLVSSIQKDQYAIGFCKLTDILDFEKQQIMENIQLMPIDRNNNGRLDSNEKIYDDLNSFSRGVWIGKFPKALYSNIYSVASEKPSGTSELAFVKWVLTDGQKYIIPTGYYELASNERQAKVDHLLASTIEIAVPRKETSSMMLILLVIAAIVVIGFLLDAAVRLLRRNKSEVSHSGSFVQNVFNEASVSIMNGLYFDKTHTWAFMEKDGLVKIGIDDFLQHLTGTITQVKMKSPGERVSKGEPILSIVQKGKQLQINSPVSGIIREQNQLLLSDSGLMNSSPYSEGWVYMIEPSNWLKEIPFLFMADKYRSWIKIEFSRLKDFLASILKPDTLQYSYVVLQDGGELRDNLLSEMNPQVWEEFQTNFINNAK
jgi:glycine cleavage system H lipoate-binding protein/ABC-type phosphate transport system substrate-binding protein